MATAELTQELIDSTPVPKRRGGRPTKTTLWDSGDGAVKGLGVHFLSPSSRSPLGRRSYCVRYTVRGKPRELSLGPVESMTLAKAREEAGYIRERASREGIDPVGEKRRGAQGSRAERVRGEIVEHAFERWQAEKLRYDDWRPSTAHGVRRLFDGHIRDEIGHRPVAEVERHEIKTLLHKVEAKYQHNRVRGWLIGFFAWAEDEGLRPEGSTPCTKLPSHTEKARGRILSLEELTACGTALDAIQAEQLLADASCDLIRLCAILGCRVGELRELRWEHVEWERKTLRLIRTKTKPRRKVLGADALALLKAREKRYGTSPFVFPSPRKLGIALQDSSRCSRRAFRLAKIEGAVSHHVYRATWATLARRMGIDSAILKVCLGHATGGGVTERHYVHIENDDETVRVAEERIQSTIARALRGEPVTLPRLRLVPVDVEEGVA